MKLSRFIEDHLEEILVEWEAFARTLQPDMTPLALRNHAKQILMRVAHDIDSSETPKEQRDKSHGLAPSDPESAAASHGTLRQISGFTLLQLTAEFRALRATVLRLWLPHIGTVTDATTYEMIRFNETIDQALAEAVVTYAHQALRARDTFLAVLGHDLRSPLATMSMAGAILTRSGVSLESAALVGARVKRSAASMSIMINDLLEYSRTALGGEIPVVPHLADMQVICQAALDDANAAHPECTFEMRAQGDLTGDFDAARMQQVFSNLLSNAAQYRSREHPVLIDLRGSAEVVTVQVCNRGPVIPRASLRAIFDPLVQLSVEDEQPGRASTSLGLGLFIARQITLAHGGSITADSSEHSGTVFTVQLPR
ncbi:MAG: putative two-component sensor histidine kinase [Betaproteobacteria bacterium]|nr:putative two-component sensor histidine kinase [Betaproteobacteria bacterium]